MTKIGKINTEDWSIMITKTLNGYILTLPLKVSLEDITHEQVVIRDSCPKKALQEVIWEVIEEFEPFSKHNDINVSCELVDRNGERIEDET